MPAVYCIFPAFLLKITLSARETPIRFCWYNNINRHLLSYRVIFCRNDNKQFTCHK